MVGCLPLTGGLILSSIRSRPFGPVALTMPITLAGEDSVADSDLAFKIAKLLGRVAGQFRKQAFELIGICRTMQKSCQDPKRHHLLLW